jgi:hypothetical protein
MNAQNGKGSFMAGGALGFNHHIHKGNGNKTSIF